MKKNLAVMAGLLMMLLVASQALAGPRGEYLNSANQVNQGLCGGSPSALMINVIQQVVGEIDSGVTGNYWAYDNSMKNIQVWQVGPDTFCVDVRYLGSFSTLAGASPGGTATLTTGIAGVFRGGYRGTVRGTLNASPSKSTKGNIGQIDYACDAAGNCPNQISWLTYYFNPGYVFSSDWWGWVYNAGNNGSWVNSSTGNQGDITP